MGGHSFALITVQQRMAEIGLDISVTDLFRFGTVADCAAYFRRAETRSSTTGPRNVSAPRRPRPTSANQQRGEHA
ncbi:hypothetical protein GCM10027614_07790 [Micromonospora vulcania]